MLKWRKAAWKYALGCYLAAVATVAFLVITGNIQNWRQAGLLLLQVLGAPVTVTFWLCFFTYVWFFAPTPERPPTLQLWGVFLGAHFVVFCTSKLLRHRGRHESRPTQQSL